MTSVLPATAPSMQSAPISQTHPYTCNTCQVAFRNHDQQRTHYHTDWQYVHSFGGEFRAGGY